MAKKKSTSAPMSKKEADALLPGVENIGADEAGSGSLESNAPKSYATTNSGPSFTAEDIPALTDKVAETRKTMEAARQREIRSKMKLDKHVERMRKLQTGEAQVDPMFQIPDSPAIKVMNAKISLGRLNEQPDNTVVANTQRVMDKKLKLNKGRVPGDYASNEEIAGVLNTKGWVNGKTLNPETGKKEPNKPWTGESVGAALVDRAIAQNLRPSSSIADHLKDLNKQATSERMSAARTHLTAKSQLEEAKGDFEEIQNRAAAARATAEEREAAASAPEVDKATGLPYGSKNTIARGKSKTDPAVEVIGEDQRNKKEPGLGSTDFADLQRSVHPLSSIIEPGGRNIKFPTHLRNPKTGDVTPVPAAKKTPISGGAIDNMLVSIKQSHSGAITGGIPTTDALAHIADAHEGLLTLKTLVPKGTQIVGRNGEAHDFHDLLASAIRGHNSAHQSILDRVTKRAKALRNTLPTQESVKEGLFKATKGNKTPVVQTIKGGRKVYDLSELTGEATSGAAGEKLAKMAKLGGRAEDTSGNIPADARASVVAYNLKKRSRNDAFGQGNGTIPTE